MQRRHQELAARFGSQPARVREASEGHARDHHAEHDRAGLAARAVPFARARTLEREAVVAERTLRRDALQRSLGEARIDDIKREVDRRVERGDFVAIETDTHAPGRSFTAPEMLQLEQETIDRVRDGQGEHQVLSSDDTREVIVREHSHLTDSQRAAVEEVLGNRDQVMGLDGTAGAGKTTTLAVIREAAEREDYEVESLAPTSRAAQKLEEAGIESRTLQQHLVDRQDDARGTAAGVQFIARILQVHRESR